MFGGRRAGVMDGNSSVRPTRDEQAQAHDQKVRKRFQQERRMQLMALLVLAAAVLVGTVLFAGWRNVFLPGWWRIW